MDINMKGRNDGDLDLESSLLQQFSCLATQDKDVLINEFQRLIYPNQLSPERSAFFLDMNNWNLQQAICSYFDFAAPRDNDLCLDPLPRMAFIKDITIGEGEEVPPDTKFVKTWRLKNSGYEKWPPGCSLRFVNGHMMSLSERLHIDPLGPGQITDVSIEMVSPIQPGIYEACWRMCTNDGQYFGEVIWVIISVAEGGLLGLTQQMNSFHQLGSPVKSHCNESIININPFASKPSNSYIREDLITTSQISNEVPTKTSTESDVTFNNIASNPLNPDSSPSDYHENCLAINNSLLNSKKLSVLYSSDESNHLPPTPPSSEDMM